MNKKIILLIVLALMLLIAVTVFMIWQKKHTSSAKTVSGPSPYVSKSPELSIPKVSEYQVPILMYHYIRDASGESEMGKNLSVWPENFDEQIKFLKNDGYESVLVKDLADPEKKAISKIIYEKKKPIALTFDDGYADAYTNALPILKKYEMLGTFYIIRNYVGRPEYMNQTQIDELAKAGMEIGSHTLSHPNLASLDAEDARAQIIDSKLDALTFCYPAGKYNETTVELLKDAGYLAAVTTHFDVADQDSDLMELPRVRVEDGSGQRLVDKISAALEQTK